MIGALIPRFPHKQKGSHGQAKATDGPPVRCSATQAQPDYSLVVGDKVRNIAMIHGLTGKHEKFCQLVAADSTYTDAYLEAFQKQPGYDRKLAAEAGSRLMGETTVQLRVQELRRPVIRKFRRRLEYGLQKALEQCDVAWDLAYEQGDPKTLLKAVDMQARLAKLLTEQIDVTHRNGLLDDTSTEVLLEMKREIEVRQAKQKVLRKIKAENVETVS